MARNVHNPLMSIAGRGELSRDIGNFEEIAMSAEAALPHPRRATDAVYPTSQLYASTKLIAEALHYTKVAAGRIFDLHGEKLEEDEQRRARARSGQASVSWRSYRDELLLDRYREEQSQARAQQAAAAGAGSRPGGPSSLTSFCASPSSGATSSGGAAAGSARRSACAASLPPGGPAQQRLKTTASSGSWQRWG